MFTHRHGAATDGGQSSMFLPNRVIS